MGVGVGPSFAHPAHLLATRTCADVRGCSLVQRRDKEPPVSPGLGLQRDLLWRGCFLVGGAPKGGLRRYFGIKRRKQRVAGEPLRKRSSLVKPKSQMVSLKFSLIRL